MFIETQFTLFNALGHLEDKTSKFGPIKCLLYIFTVTAKDVHTTPTPTDGSPWDYIKEPGQRNGNPILADPQQ
ncbi:hypothetical protein NBRC116495_36950 [Aurantivibrio plasticivorans]